MSSFYDKTEAILEWAEREKLPPQELAEILNARLTQCEEHFLWAAVEFKPALDLYCDLLRGCGFQMLQKVGRWVYLEEIPEEMRNVLWVAHRFLSQVAAMPAECVYEGGIKTPGSVLGALSEVFEIYHSFGHALGKLKERTRRAYLRRYLDPNPFPGKRQNVSNSDKWLREKYPGEPWEKR